MTARAWVALAATVAACAVPAGPSSRVTKIPAAVASVAPTASAAPIAPAVRFPLVVSAGGPVLASPRVVGVAFANETPENVARLGRFVTTLGESAYWRTVASEYGVGAFTGRWVRSPEEAPAAVTDAAIQSWLRGHASALGLRSGDLALVFYPASTVVTSDAGEGCVRYLGYHASLPLAAGDAAYAVVPRCNPWSDQTDPLEATTVAAAHELVEATVNPYAETQPAYGYVDEAHFGWALASFGGAPTDLCQMAASDARIVPSDLPFFVARVWSNEAARRGNDPCVPVPPDERYVVAVPDLPEEYDVTLGLTHAHARAVRVPAGERRTIDVAVVGANDPAQASAEPWTLSADDGTSRTHSPPIFALSLDRTEAKVGDHVHLTIESLYLGGSAMHPFVIYTRRDKTRNVWAGLVVQ